MPVNLVSGGDDTGSNPPDHALMIRDLLKSGLAPQDVNARVIENAERAATVSSGASKGYTLPYFDDQGKLLPFYRVKLFDSDTTFKQPKDSSNHVYFPKGFSNIYSHHASRIVILTTTEVSAACAVKFRFPAVGLGSSSSWRNRTILISGDAALSHHQSKLAIKLPAGGDTSVGDFDHPLAIGLRDLIAQSLVTKAHFVIIFPSQYSRGPNADHQTEAFELGCELRLRGIPYTRIHQLCLPWTIPGPTERREVSLDNFLMSSPDANLELWKLLTTVIDPTSRSFPRHPNVVEHVNRMLQRPKLGRRETIALSLSILSDLDSHGIRLRATTTEAYYFDYATKKLLKSAWASYRGDNVDAPFTQYLHQTYGLSSADHRLFQWLSIQFTSEAPIAAVTPHSIFAHPEDETENALYYQLSDSEFIEVTSQTFTIHNNGDKNILFESDQVEPLNSKILLEQLNAQAKKATTSIDCWWASTLSQVRLRDKDKQRIVAALLYYMSPWLLRWRGMQLPVELIVGESGSGKSTLCELRLDILSGRPLLRNTPTDLKDWHASVTNTGGLHVTDNAQLVDKGLRQRLSDEICRIVTEPNPFIEQRKYYTNADLIRIPVKAVFAITAIQQPFQNADLLQRAIILELDKSIDLQEGKAFITYDSHWKQQQLERFGGREAWVAHHLLVLQRFFKLVDQKWNPRYSAKNRLINFEQSILLMAEVFSIPSQWIPDYLINATDKSVSEADWVLEGLHSFALEHNIPSLRSKRFKASLICDWCTNQPEYKSNEFLTNPRKLGRYLRAHKSAIQHLTGIIEGGSENNSICYTFKGRTLERR